MDELLKQKRIKRTSKIVFIISLILTIISIIIGILAELNTIGWVGRLNIWSLCLRLPIGLFIVLAIVYFGIWLAAKRKSKASKLGNLAGFAYSIILLIGVVIALELLSDRAQVVQMDAFEEICKNGFNDPATLRKYETGYVVVGNWEYVLVWEDENHNAIWFDTCDTLSACGIVCIRKGIPLEDATIYMGPNTKFQYIREGLYWWR
jgi:hypothetical protein